MLNEVIHSTKDTELIVYYSGHGFTDAVGKTVIGTDDPRSVLTLAEMRSVLSHHRGEVTILLDSCRDRHDVFVDIGDTELLMGPNPPNVLMGTGAGTLAIESETLGASVFTAAVERHLERALLGRSDARKPGACALQANSRGGAVPGYSCTDGDHYNGSLDPGGGQGDHQPSCIFRAFDGGAAEVCTKSRADALTFPCYTGTGNVTLGEGTNSDADNAMGCTASVAAGLVASFDSIAEETADLARVLHGVNQAPVLMTEEEIVQ